jgi:hypothetical protein
MTIFPDFEKQLVKLASAAAGPSRRSRPHRWRVGVGTLIAAASTLVVLGVGAIILLNVRGTAESGPSAGNGAAGLSATAHRALFNAMGSAERQTWSRDAACRPGLVNVPHPQHVLYGSPGRSLTSVLGMLRRPAPRGQRVSPEILHQLQVNAQGVYIRYARRGQVNGVAYYLIPAASVNDLGPFPGRCYTEQLNAFRQLIAHRPAAERATDTLYEQQALRSQRRLANAPAGVCLITNTTAEEGEDCRWTTELRLMLGGGLVRSAGNDQATVTALVLPDAVATVSAHYPAEHQRGQVTRALTVTKHVVDNIVIFNLAGVWDPPSLTYRSAAGKILWSSP